MSVNTIVPDASVVAAVLMATSAPSIAGPETVTLLPTALDVVILPFRVTPPEPVKTTVLIPFAV